MRCADDDPLSCGCEIVVEKFIGIDCGTLEETWANVFLKLRISRLLFCLKRLSQAEEAEHEVPVVVSRGGQFDSEDVVINPSITRCDSRFLIFRFPEISQPGYAVIILSMHGLEVVVDWVWGGWYRADGGEEGDDGGV